MNSLSGFGYTIDTADFREKADVNAPIIQQLNKYTLCRVIDTVALDGIAWYQVAYDGKTGYIDGMYFKQMTTLELDRFLGSAEYKEGIRGSSETPAPQKTYSAGDIITFGHYEQDNNLNNGQEEIDWIVLDYDAAENKALLLSRYGLDSKKYHERYNYGYDERYTWEKCSLRSWLNGEFLKTAFTAEEQQEVLITNVDNSKSQGYSGWTDGGNDTVDQVFLLSYQEAFEEYLKDDQSRICKPTAYAIAQGAISNHNSRSGWWWLRSPGHFDSCAANVLYFGTRNDNVIDCLGGCVRPALWVNLNSGIF